MSSPQPKMSPEELYKYVDYCDDTGEVTLKSDAHHPDIRQYYRDCIWVQGYNYTYPRISFYLHHGFMPARIARIGSPLDIRIENLQAVEPQVRKVARKLTTLKERQQKAYDALPDKEKARVDRLRRQVRNASYHSVIVANRKRESKLQRT